LVIFPNKSLNSSTPERLGVSYPREVSEALGSELQLPLDPPNWLGWGAKINDFLMKKSLKTLTCVSVPPSTPTYLRALSASA